MPAYRTEASKNLPNIKAAIAMLQRIPFSKEI
jgi:hypothetical protein